MRTKAEIDAEVTKLQTMKPNVRRTSMFGDNHHHAIDAQVSVLTGQIDEDDIYEELDAENEQTAASDAALWMNGESDDAPSSEWESLLVK